MGVTGSRGGAPGVKGVKSPPKSLVRLWMRFKEFSAVRGWGGARPPSPGGATPVGWGVAGEATGREGWGPPSWKCGKKSGNRYLTRW